MDPVFYQYQNASDCKGVRLYEPPQNLPPLVLAKALYQLDFERMVMSREKGQLKFNHLIQATMLDLIDRGNLRLTRDDNGETLTCLHYEGLADFELKFIEMIFDQESAINISEVFSKYKIDKVALKKTFELLNQTRNETVFERSEMRFNPF